jgi:hypothetical protein
MPKEDLYQPALIAQVHFNAKSKDHAASHGHPHQEEPQKRQMFVSHQDLTVIVLFIQMGLEDTQHNLAIS